jgi:hypothetical protein
MGFYIRDNRFENSLFITLIILHFFDEAIRFLPLIYFIGIHFQEDKQNCKPPKSWSSVGEER